MCPPTAGSAPLSDWLMSLPLSVYLGEDLMSQQFGGSLIFLCCMMLHVSENITLILTTQFK